MSDVLTLAQAQARVGAALRSLDARAPAHAAIVAAACAALDGDAARNARRLAVYRANAIANATAALRAHYPVIARIVGAEFFAQLARAYCGAHASTSGDLGEYGAALADFVAHDVHAQGLPYLPDLARLEWAVHRAETAADVPDAARAAHADAQQLLRAPGSTVLASAHPIAEIWHAHQDDATLAPADIVWRAQGAWVYRDGWQVRVAALDADQAHALIDLMAQEAA